MNLRVVSRRRSFYIKYSITEINFSMTNHYLYSSRSQCYVPIHFCLFDEEKFDTVKKKVREGEKGGMKMTNPNE